MISKETKNIHGLLLFFCIHESSISSLKIKSLKTTLVIYLTATGSPPFNFKCSAPRAVRPADSTCGALPLHFFVVFLYFLFKGGLRFVISTKERSHKKLDNIYKKADFYSLIFHFREGNSPRLLFNHLHLIRFG